MRKFFFAVFAVFVLTPGTINAAANATACWEMMKTACSGKCIVSAGSDSDAFSFKCGGTNGCPTGAIIWNQEKRKHYQCGSNGWTVISNETMNKNVENIRNCGDANADPSSTYPAFYNHEKYEFIREHKKNSFLFKSDICKKPKSNAGGVQSSQNSETINSPRSAPATSTTQPQSSDKYITVKGRVLDDQNTPLQWATISVVGSSSEGTTADSDGYFTIPNVNENAQLEFRFVGFKTITRMASDINTTQPVILEEDAAGLDEVSVIECSNINEIYDVDEEKCVPDECEPSGGTRDADKKCECKADLGLEPDDAENPQKCQCKENGYGYDPNKKICISTEKNAPEPETIDEEACVNSGGYVQENKCVCVSEKHLTTPDNKTCVCDDDTKYEFNDTAKQCVPKNPFDEEAKKRLQEAKDKLTEADENEQSWANRALTSVSTAATGLGTMAAFSAYSEQQADKEAEQDMSNWLATMTCEYGNHQQVKAGNEEISLPGGDLFDYYNEYKQLADRLKTTKTALGLRKGIESEVLYEQAQTGLYQNSNIGKTGGAYTSLARAMTDKESEDAAAWAEQKQDSKTKLWAGVAAAGVGVVGGAIGNYLINGDESASFDGLGFGGNRNKNGTNNNSNNNSNNNKNENDDETAQLLSSASTVSDASGQHGSTVSPSNQVSAVLVCPWNWLFSSTDSTTFDGATRTVKGKSVTAEETMAYDVQHIKDFLNLDKTNAKTQCVTVDARPVDMAQRVLDHYINGLKDFKPEITIEYQLNQRGIYNCAQDATVCDDIFVHVYNRPCGGKLAGKRKAK